MKTKTLHLPMFFGGLSLTLIYGTQKEAEYRMKLNCHDKNFTLEAANAAWVYTTDREGKPIYWLWFNKYGFKGQHIITSLVHECYHVITELSIIIGERGATEYPAQIVGWIGFECYKFIQEVAPERLK